MDYQNVRASRVLAEIDLLGAKHAAEIKKWSVVGRNALRESDKAVDKNVLEGKATFTDRVQYAKSLLAWELGLTAKPEERIALQKKYVQLAKEAERIMDHRLEAGKSSTIEVEASRVARIEAELALLHEEAGEKPTAQQTERRKSLLRERREALLKVYEAYQEAVKARRNTVHDLLNASLELLKADLELAENPADQLALYEKYFKQTKEYEEKHKMRLDSRREAEIALLRAKIQLKKPEP
jgi:hypothetical protein